MEENTLDAVDSLHHLFSPNDSDVLQPPAPSLCLGDQIVKINFACPIQQAEESYRTITLSLLVDPSPGCGGIAWPAGEVLACYIARRGLALQGTNVLELGSGTGLVGLVAGYLGAHVCITDQAYVAPLSPFPW